MSALPKRKTMRLSCLDYNEAGMYFITICTIEKRCILARVVGTGVLDGPQIELLPYGKLADTYIRQLDRFYERIHVESYVIMPNHIHLLLRVNEPDGPSGTPVPTVQNSIVSRFVSTFKRFMHKECGERIWQNRSYDHVIRNDRDYEDHLRYIDENPFRWNTDVLYVET